MECFRGTILKRTLTVAFLYSTNNWVGAAFLAQSTYLLLMVGLPAVHCFDIGIGGCGLAIIVIICLGIFGHKVSKRWWLLSGIILNFLFMTTIGALLLGPRNGSRVGYWCPNVRSYLYRTVSHSLTDHQSLS
jgi:hypothetical protein